MHLKLNPFLTKSLSAAIQAVPKGTETFQSFIIKKLDNLQKKISYH